MTFDEKVKWLMEKLDRVYCDNCGNEECDDCHRKYMEWKLGKHTAIEIVKQISELK